MVKTIHHNEIDDDEFAAGGFTISRAKAIHAPVINEAFLSMECTLKEIQDLSGAGITAMVIGQVQHISVEESYAQGYNQRYGKDGFMMLIPAPQTLLLENRTNLQLQRYILRNTIDLGKGSVQMATCKVRSNTKSLYTAMFRPTLRSIIMRVIML